MISDHTRTGFAAWYWATSGATAGDSGIGWTANEFMAHAIYCAADIPIHLGNTKPALLFNEVCDGGDPLAAAQVAQYERTLPAHPLGVALHHVE